MTLKHLKREWALAKRELRDEASFTDRYMQRRALPAAVNSQMQQKHGAWQVTNTQTGIVSCEPTSAAVVTQLDRRQRMTEERVNTQTGEIVLADHRDLTEPAVRKQIVDELSGQVLLVQEAMQSVLKRGVHYGVIPGTGRPSLWQPGAEALCQMFGFQTRMTRTDKTEDWAAGIFSYTYRCELLSRNGMFITDREGTCSTEEGKYKDVQSARPSPYDPAKVLRGIPAAEQRETMMQMAQKRAYVSAVKASAAASAIFSMDDELVQDGAPATAAGGYGKCATHGVAFFKTGKMRSPAHRTDEGGWCNKPSEAKPRPPVTPQAADMLDTAAFVDDIGQGVPTEQDEDVPFGEDEHSGQAARPATAALALTPRDIPESAVGRSHPFLLDMTLALQGAGLWRKEAIAELVHPDVELRGQRALMQLARDGHSLEAIVRAVLDAQPSSPEGEHDKGR